MTMNKKWYFKLNSDWTIPKRNKQSKLRNVKWDWPVFRIELNWSKGGIYFVINIKYVCLFRLEIDWIPRPSLFFRLFGLGFGLYRGEQPPGP